MNCSQVRRYLYAFADGELDVKENCEVLDHLKMCPACTRLVADQQALRSQLRKSVASISVPGDLAGKFWARVRAEQQPERPSTVRILRPMAIAASITVAIGVGWWYWPVERISGTSDNRNGTPARFASTNTPNVQKVVTRHCSCVGQGLEHQCPQLPRTLDGLRGVAAAEFGAQIEVMVPDLRDKGYVFQSVNRCGIDGERAGMHLVYVNSVTQSPLSFFCVPRCKTRCKKHCTVDGKAYDIEKATINGTTYVVAGWECPRGRSSFFACGDLPEDQIVDVADAARVALCKPASSGRTRLALAD